MVYAEHAFRLGARHDDGASVGDHLESGAEQMRKFGLKPKVAVLPDAPPFPDPLLYLWTWFNEHCLGLACSGMAPPMATWESLSAWCALTRISLEPWEANAMISMSAKRAQISMEKTKPNG